ncbi:MAG: hypothetical protein GY898_32315 [Proteobacteria bacterium]|nr:hypothetical protein [Pseudomonadota bacterium]
MTPERLLRIAAAYHGLMGAVLLLLAQDFFTFLKLEPPRHWLFYMLAASTPAAAGFACDAARRRPDLRPGLLFGLIAGNLVAAVVIIGVVTWTQMPTVLYGSGIAAGLWAWMFWNVYSPEPTDEEPAPS